MMSCFPIEVLLVYWLCEYSLSFLLILLLLVYLVIGVDILLVYSLFLLSVFLGLFFITFFMFNLVTLLIKGFPCSFCVCLSLTKYYNGKKCVLFSCILLHLLLFSYLINIIFYLVIIEWWNVDFS